MSNLNESDIEFKIVKNIAHKYGFILRYPKGKEDITGYKYEPWHKICWKRNSKRNL